MTIQSNDGMKLEIEKTFSTDGIKLGTFLTDGIKLLNESGWKIEFTHKIPLSMKPISKSEKKRINKIINRFFKKIK